MGQAELIIVSFSVMALVLVGYAALAGRARRRHLGHSFIGPFEDMWHPAAHKSEIVIEAQAEQGAPAPAPCDPPKR